MTTAAVWLILNLCIIIFVFLFFVKRRTEPRSQSCTVNAPSVYATIHMDGEIEIDTKALRIALVCSVCAIALMGMIALIHGMKKQIDFAPFQKIARGTVLAMFFTIASKAVSVLCVIKERLDRHVEDLIAAVAKLHGVETTLCRLEQIPFAKQCHIWLKSVGDFHRTAQDIKIGYDRCGLDYSKRLHLSRRARQELNLANDLLMQGDNLLHPQDELPGTTNFYKKKVINFIQDMDDETGSLGIWGMGGVGKTSLLKLLVGDYCSQQDNDSFQVLFVRVGTGCTVCQVQDAIAASVGLSLEHNENSQAKRIHDHLKDTSFLLLLDDLWGYLDLKAVGIPSPLGTVRAHLEGGVVRRKVVLTSRNMDLCHKMGCSHDNTIQMKCLDEVEAWNLFNRGWPVPRVDVIENLPQVQTTSNSSHIGRQRARRQPHTVGDIQPQPPQDVQMSSYDKMCSFIEDEGAESLLLGVWGMRGVGKTTLLRLMRESYTCKARFDHILFVGAGTGQMVNNVQHAIAINLGLDLTIMSSLDELSRAELISNYLEHKSFLLLLDDIREPFNWWAIGLPLFLHKHQKIILATRSQATCALMGCHVENTIEMQCLGEADAWSLFTDKAGKDDNPQVRHFAQKMVARCGGLPLALSALGRAMSSKRDPREWRCAYNQLNDTSMEMCEIDDKVCNIILHSLLWNKKSFEPMLSSKNLDYDQNARDGSRSVPAGAELELKSPLCTTSGHDARRYMNVQDYYGFWVPRTLVGGT